MNLNHLSKFHLEQPLTIILQFKEERIKQGKQKERGKYFNQVSQRRLAHLEASVSSKEINLKPIPNRKQLRKRHRTKKGENLGKNHMVSPLSTEHTNRTSEGQLQLWVTQLQIVKVHYTKAGNQFANTSRAMTSPHKH